MFSCRKVPFVILFLCLVLLRCTGEELPEESDESPMSKSEQEALYSAIQGFVGYWWNGSDLYPDPCGWTPIQGVSCDLYEDGLWYVTSLTLGPVHENSLACATSLEINPKLFELKHLKSLAFFNCFNSPITITREDWTNFDSSLESLEFRSNSGLIGEFPDSIGNLKKLQSLVVLENGFNGRLPMCFCRLTRLKRLVLAENSFTGTIPDCFNGMKELLIMDLSNNSLSGSLPFSVGNLVSLLKLDLSYNMLEGKLPKEIRFLKNLTLLDLRDNKFSGGLSQNVENIQSLTELVLSNNPVGGDMKGIKWEKMGNLAILDLSKMGLEGEIPNGLTKLKKLRFLGLNNNNLTGNVPKKLETLPCLGALYINGNNLTGQLKFSRMFYEKMGRRFGAWGNPNLCHPFEIMSTTQQHVPVGVTPCIAKLQEANLVIQQDSKTLIWNRRFSNMGLSLSIYMPSEFIWVLMVVLQSIIALDC